MRIYSLPTFSFGNIFVLCVIHFHKSTVISQPRKKQSQLRCDIWWVIWYFQRVVFQEKLTWQLWCLCLCLFSFFLARLLKTRKHSSIRLIFNKKMAVNKALSQCEEVIFHLSFLGHRSWGCRYVFHKTPTGMSPLTGAVRTVKWHTWTLYNMNTQSLTLINNSTRNQIQSIYAGGQYKRGYCSIKICQRRCREVYRTVRS